MKTTAAQNHVTYLRKKAEQQLVRKAGIFLQKCKKGDYYL